MTLKDFPRGGKKTKTQTPLNFLSNKKEKIKNKKAKSEKKEDEQSYIEGPILPNVAQSLAYSSITEGMTLLGRVHSLTDYDVSVSLPGRLIGHLPLTNISEAYTNLLQTLIQGENNQPPEFKPLNELYKRGDYLVCYIKNVNLEEKHQIILSTEPELLNQSLDPGKLEKGLKIVCSISSIEDHGYVVDTGMKVLRGFLSYQDIENDVQYYTGQQIFCAIKNVKSVENITTVKLSTKTKHTTSVVDVNDQSLDAITPGVSMTLEIKKILSNGLQVTFNRKNTGYINQLYLAKRLTSYVQGTCIVGKLLYILPTVKLAYFSESLLTDRNNETIKIGEIVENAKFLFRQSNGIILKLKKGIRGVVSFKQTGIKFDAIPSKFLPNSFHKCRVIGYDIFDNVYVCTMQRNMLNEKVVMPENVKIGDVMTVEIMRINKENGFIFVKSGKIGGDVPPEQVCDIRAKSQNPQIGAKIKAKVLRKNKQGNGWIFTLKKSLVNSELPILSDMNDAKVGSTFHGTIIRISHHGLLVSFFNNIKGSIPSKKISKKTGGILNYTVGQVVLVRIDHVNKEEEKLLLSIVDDETKINKEIKFQIGETVEGIVVESSIDGVYLRISDDNNSESIIGFLPAGHMAPCSEIATYLSSRCIPGDKMSALVFSTIPDFLLTRTFVPQEKYTNINQLKIGDCIPCSIKDINNKTGLKVVLPIKKQESYGIVPFNKIDDIESVFTHQLLFGKIININKKEKKITLSTLLIDVWSDAIKHDIDMIGAVDLLTLYLSKLKELSSQKYYEAKAISSLHLGERVTGVVDKVTDHGLVLKLDNNVTGTVRLAHCKGSYKVGDKVKGTVLWINFIHELVDVTLLPMLANSISEKQGNLPAASLEIQLRGEVVLITNWFILAVLKGQGKGTIVALPSHRHVNDMQPNLTSYTIGKKIRCYVVLNKNESELLPICLLKSAFELKKKLDSQKPKEIKRKIDSCKNGDDLLIKKIKKPINAMNKNEEQVNKENENLQKIKKVEKQIKRKRDELENTECDSEKEKKKNESAIEDRRSEEIMKNLSIPECGFFWDSNPSMELMEKIESSSESSDDEKIESEQQNKKKKKLSATERRELERQKEREIREREEALASNQMPNSVDQFDRLVLASPDSSLIWLQYMAYHLQATEIDKARAVAKRALKTISFREENEKLNVWQAWLNLESRFGTPESLNDVFQQAVNANDSKNIYLHMLTIHADAGRHVELEKMVKTVIGKFKQLPQMWVEVGTAFLKMGLKDKSRHIMQRALQSLPAQEHVNLMVKFAQLENKFGDKERAQTLFEKILSSYPKRLDVWSCYVDLLVKNGDIDGARQVLNKAVIQTLPPRKMRTLFKKLIDFEEQHGSTEGVIRARELAVAYVNKQCNQETN